MKDNQHEQLFTELTAEFEAPAFTELDNEVAASCSGGTAYLYENANFTGKVWIFEKGSADLRGQNFNDKTSSIIITGNERWAFYRDINYGGQRVILGQGRYSFVPDVGIPNDSISSLKRA
ncbi:MAG: beta/gamma crystallin family protein [Iphinoe sp. HA4291-MV1]|jgi:hypothetical protein|nr:beta/gamma crystallin family protein [Iphinoe sp. HA4291-MV1]